MSMPVLLPRGLHGLWPLLCVCWTLGVLPYSLKPPLRVVRTKVGMVILCIPVLAEVAFLITTFMIQHESHLVPVRGTFVSTALTISVTMVCTLLVPLAFVCFVTMARPVRCQRLLHFLAAAEVILGDEMKSPPFLVRRPWVIVILVVIGVFTCSKVYFQYNFSNDSILQSIFEVWVMLLLVAFVYLFFCMCFVMKYYFDTANRKLLLIISKIRNESGEGKQLKREFQTMILNEVARITAVPGTDIFPTSETTQSVEDAIGDIREAHFSLNLACDVINDIFTTGLLVFYLHVLIVMVACLYFAGLSSSFLLSSLEEAILWATAACTTFVGAVVAWGAGSATSAGYDDACATATAVLMAGRGLSAVEHEMHLFLLQLRPDSSSFYAGKIFPLNLRFFVQLLGAIIGYLAVVMQFVVPEFPPTCSLCSAVNVTEFCVTYLRG